MARNINLNSAEWCDMIFEGKNKEYGAYAMRQTSTKRHIIALGIVFLFTALIAFIPQFIKAVSVEKEDLGGIAGPIELTDIAKPEEPKPEEEIIAQSLAVPPPAMVAAVRFTPPVITNDADVNAENEMQAQETLRESRGIISTVNFESDLTTGGVDPGEVLAEHRNITGEGAGTGPIDFAEVMPQFPGGQSELTKYLSSNLRYPTIAVENNVQGRVIVKFVVTKDGTIQNAHIVKTLDPLCDKEAIRVIESMPRWVAGMQNGNKVAVYFTLPIYFKLQS